MKFVNTIATILALAAFPSSSVAQSTLEEKWAIGENPGFAYDGLQFDLTYTISDYITTNQAYYEIYTEECRGNGTEYTLDTGDDASNVGMYLVSFQDTTVASPNEGTVADVPVTLQLSLDSDTISSSAFYNENATVGDVTATVRFCVRFGLNTLGDTPIEVNFQETIVTLTVDLSSGFTIDDVSVAPKDRLERTAAQAYLVEGYLCSADNAALEGEALSATRNQGALIRVCVRPDADAQADEIYMRSIDSFSWTRSDLNLEQAAIVSPNTAAENLLTTVTCTSGDAVCSFESILFAAFYANAGTVSGEGIASLQFGNVAPAARRGLRAGDDAARDLQEAAAATSEFDLSFGIDQGTGGQPGSGASSVVATTTMAMSVIGFVAAML